MGGNAFVSFRVPFTVVDAIKDAGHGFTALLEHAFQAKAEFCSLNLLAVTSAHGGHEIRIRDRALQEIHVSKKFHFCDREEVPGESEQGQNLWRKQALVANIVDREHRSCAAESRVFVVLRL